MSALLVLLAAASSLHGAVPTSVEAPADARHFGVHLGLNATAAFDAELGDLFYGEVATQLTGLGALVAPEQGFVLSGFVMGGVTLPLVRSPGYRLQFDVGPHLTLLRSFPDNIVSGGVVAGLRWVNASGLTLGFKLPLVGYAGSIDQPRGGLLYYYVAAIATAPLFTVGYSF